MAKVNMMQLQEAPPTKPAKMLCGYGVDGVPFYAPIKIPVDAELCRQCEGMGCTECDGEGVIYSGQEDET